MANPLPLDRYTLDHSARIATGSTTSPRGAEVPAYRPVLNSLIADGRCGRLLLLTESPTNPSLSTISRKTLVGWLRNGGYTLPAELQRAISLDEALVILEDLQARVNKLECRAAQS